MRRLFLASAAMASLAIGLTTAQAQQAQDRERMPAASRSHQSAPSAADQQRNRASPRGQQSSSSTGPNRAASGNNQIQRGALNARAQQQNDNASAGRAEPLRQDQARERSGDRPRRDARD